VKEIQKIVSFSNVVAMLALFLALGGSVYAASNKINGRQIKAKSIPGNRIKPRGLTGNQIKPGSLTGKQVVGKSLTGVDASGLAAVNYTVTSVNLVKFKPGGTTASASCPAGQKVLGGGAVVNKDLEASINDSGPQVSRGGWEATGYTGSDGMSMTVTAICTRVVSTDGQQSSVRDDTPSPAPPVYYFRKR
jgi:hypothetical protein